MSDLSYEQAFRWFGYKPGESVTLENLYLRLANWRNNNSGDPDQYYTKMNHAYAVLASELVKVAWNKISLFPIPVEEALVMFGYRTWDSPPCRFTVNYKFRLLAPRRSATLKDAEQFDSAYRVLYDHAERRDNDHDYILEPPFAPIFKAIAAKDAGAGWDTTKHFNEHITYKEAEAVFGIDVRKHTSSEVTALFRKLQGQCTSVEEAHKLDCAYRFLFSVLITHERHFSAPIDSPYAPVLAKKLGLPLPVVKIEPVIADEIKEEGKTPTLSEESIFLGMSVDEARLVLKFEKNEAVTLEVLYARYKDASAANDSKVIQEEIDTAYRVLIAHLEDQIKEMAEEKARTLYKYGKDDIIEQDDLLEKFTTIIKNAELAHLHDEAKKAYQVLLKVAV